MYTDQVTNYVDANLEKIRGPEDVAIALQVPYETLRKQFRRRERRTLGAYVTECRVAHAQVLLKTTDLTCYQICDEVGFPRDDTGAKIFKRVTGVTMMQYRKGSKPVSRSYHGYGTVP